MYEQEIELTKIISNAEEGIKGVENYKGLRIVIAQCKTCLPDHVGNEHNWQFVSKIHDNIFLNLTWKEIT